MFVKPERARELAIEANRNQLFLENESLIKEINSEILKASKNGLFHVVMSLEKKLPKFVFLEMKNLGYEVGYVSMTKEGLCDYYISWREYRNK